MWKSRPMKNVAAEYLFYVVVPCDHHHVQKCSVLLHVCKNVLLWFEVSSVCRLHFENFKITDRFVLHFSFVEYKIDNVTKLLVKIPKYSGFRSELWII